MANGFGGILDQLIGGYTQIEVAKANRDAARYEAAPAVQDQGLHGSEAYSGSEAYRSGNAANPARSTVIQVNQPLLWGSVGLLGFALLLKAVK